MNLFKMLMMAALTILSVSVFAQDSTMQKMKTHKQKTEKVRYSCPMHPGMTSKKPGKCSVCGMDLTKSKRNQIKMEVMKTYSCPMKCEGDKTYDKPGKCPVCGMKLKENVKATVAYSCPMKCEGDKTYDKPGKCPVCGMNLKEKKDDDANHQH
jgi:uncharacterized paraquat-inducible protein A